MREIKNNIYNKEINISISLKELILLHDLLQTVDTKVFLNYMKDFKHHSDIYNYEDTEILYGDMNDILDSHKF